MDEIDILNGRINDAISHLHDSLYRLNKNRDYQGFKDKLNCAYAELIDAFWEATDALDSQANHHVDTKTK